MEIYNYLEEKRKFVKIETLKIHKLSPEIRLASSLSPIEIFVSLYYGNLLKYNPENPLDDNRDRFIISKGHGSICMYPILADLGFFDKNELRTVGQNGTFLGGIPDPVIPGYETVNGSLGHGLGVSCGIAIGLQRKNYAQNVVVLTGDGELYEGSNWEAFMFAGHHKLENLTAIIDYNKVAMLDFVDKIVTLEPLADKLKSFNWQVFEIEDGHDIKSVYDMLKKAIKERNGKPKAVIAHTIKGKGVPFLEKHHLSHVLSLTPDEIDSLLKELQNEN